MNHQLIAAIQPFEQKMTGMTVEQMRQELAQTNDVKWREALDACLQLKGNDT